MVSMGAGAEIEQLKQQLKRPKALIIGAFLITILYYYIIHYFYALNMFIEAYFT